MAVTVSTVLGPRWIGKQRAQDCTCSSDQTRPDHLSYQLRCSRDQRGGVAQSLPSRLPLVSESVLGSRPEARRAGEAMGVGRRYGRKADTRMARARDEQSRAEKDKSEPTRTKVGEGKTEPS